MAIEGSEQGDAACPAPEAEQVLNRGYGGQDALIPKAWEFGLQRLREASRGRLEDTLRRAQAA